MKNFNRFLIAAVALIAGFAMSACTPDDIDDKKQGKTTVAVSVGDITPTFINFVFYFTLIALEFRK